MSRNALEDALYDKLKGDTTLMGYVSGVYNGAGAGAYPQLIFGLVSGEDDYTLTRRIVTSYLFDIRIIGMDGDKATMLTALDRVDTVLFDATLSVGGTNAWYVRREGDLPDMYAKEGDRTLLQVGATYRIEIGG